MVYSKRLGCELVELNIQSNHVHFLVNISPNESIAKLIGTVIGKTALQIYR